MSNEVDCVGSVTEDDVNTMIDYESKILEKLTEVCVNLMIKHKYSLDESLTKAIESEKMRSEDIAMKSLTNVINVSENAIYNSSYRILETYTDARENVTVKSDEAFGKTHSDTSCKIRFLMGSGDVSENEITSGVGKNLTDVGGNLINPKNGIAEDLTNTLVECCEMDKCIADAVGNVALNSEDVPVKSFVHFKENIDNAPIFEEGLSNTNQCVSFENASSIESEIEELLTEIVNAVINYESKILKLTEVCENLKVRHEDRLEESLTNASEKEKMSSEDISMNSLTNVINVGENTINNVACGILESCTNASENVTVGGVNGTIDYDGKILRKLIEGCENLTSNEVDCVGSVTEDDFNAMIDYESKILEKLTEVSENLMIKHEDRLDESLTNAGEIEKLSSEDISMKSLTDVMNVGENAINNSAYRILSYTNARENITEKNNETFGETHSDASCKSTFLVCSGDVSENEITSEVGKNLTDVGENVKNPKSGFAEGLTNTLESCEMDKCISHAIGNAAMNLQGLPVKSFIDIRESIDSALIFGEGFSNTNQSVSFANVSRNESEIEERLTDTVGNIVSNIESDGTKEGTSFSSENNESFVEYQENSEYSFSQLEERKKPIEIKTPGKFVLSNTDNGESSVLFEPNFYTRDEAWELFDFLHDSTGWLDKNIIIHGIEYPQPRLVAWYGPLPYTYSGTTLKSADMPQCVLDIKSRVEDYLKDHNINVELNSVLLNLYRDNKDSVSWHSDDEFTMGVCPTIASVSLGDTRKFEMRPKSNRHYEDEHEKKGDEYFVNLSNGSLIIMDGCMQEDWQHRVPKEYHDKAPRINLTFRTVYEYEKGARFSKSPRKSRHFRQRSHKRQKLEAENESKV